MECSGLSRPADTAVEGAAARVVSRPPQRMWYAGDHTVFCLPSDTGDVSAMTTAEVDN